MFKQRMQSVLMQDRKILRQVFEEFDVAKTGQLNLDQFHATLNRLAPSINIDKKLAQELLKRFSQSPGIILFQDFVTNFLGLPQDFFTMKLSGSENANAPPEKEKTETTVKEFKYGTPVETVKKTFIRRIRRRLLNVKAAIAIALKRPNETTMHFNENDLWNLMRDQGMMCTAKEIKEIMNHFDLNQDGKIHYEEFVHELLGLPRPAAVSHIKPFYERRQPLSPEAQNMIHRLAIKCERAAAPPLRIHAMFKAFDKDGSGSIAYDEFLAMVKEFGCEMEGNDIAAVLLNKFDKTGNGGISYTEFTTDVLGLQANALVKDGNARVSTPEIMQCTGNAIKNKLFTNPEAIAKGFEIFDKDRGGSLSFAEFREGISKLGLPITTSQINRLFKEFDKKGEGEISTADFASQVLGAAKATIRQQTAGSHARNPLPPLISHRVPTFDVAQSSRCGTAKNGGAPRMPPEFMPSRSKSELDGRITRNLGATQTLGMTHRTLGATQSLLVPSRGSSRMDLTY